MNSFIRVLVYVSRDRVTCVLKLSACEAPCINNVKGSNTLHVTALLASQNLTNEDGAIFSRVC
jgi:hypothetical protein